MGSMPLSLLDRLVVSFSDVALLYMWTQACPSVELGCHLSWGSAGQHENAPIPLEAIIQQLGQRAVTIGHHPLQPAGTWSSDDAALSGVSRPSFSDMPQLTWTALSMQAAYLVTPYTRPTRLSCTY